MTDARATPRAPLLVLGLGNRLLLDDAAGLELLELLRADLRGDPRVELVDGGTLGTSLLGLFDGRDAALLVDAVDLGKAPGTVFETAEPGDLAAPRGIGGHGSNASELLALAALTGCAPARTELVGLQVERVATGVGLSASVRKGLEPARAAARARVEALLAHVQEEQPCTS